jgi:hypothetical protein
MKLDVDTIMLLLTGLHCLLLCTFLHLYTIKKDRGMNRHSFIIIPGFRESQNELRWCCSDQGSRYSLDIPHEDSPRSWARAADSIGIKARRGFRWSFGQEVVLVAKLPHCIYIYQGTWLIKSATSTISSFFSIDFYLLIQEIEL